MYSADIAGYSEEVENVMENGNVVNEAVHKRNVLFEEYAKLTFNTMPVGQHEIITKLQAEVRAPNGDFQFLSNRSSRSRCAYLCVSVQRQKQGR